MLTLPIEVFQFPPSARQKICPSERILAQQWQTTFGDLGSHGQICTTQFDQVDLIRRNAYCFRHLSAQGKTETLRRKMAEAISVASDKIDLIELRRANLGMRAEKVTELVVSGSDKFITEFLLKAVAEK